MEKLDDHVAAAREAFEEAGVAGRVSDTAIGHFNYDKVLKSGDSNTVDVTVFELEVQKPLRDWPEKTERKRQWFTVEEAAEMVHEPSLKKLILKLAE